MNSKDKHPAHITQCRDMGGMLLPIPHKLLDAFPWYLPPTPNLERSNLIVVQQIQQRILSHLEEGLALLPEHARSRLLPIKRRVDRINVLLIRALLHLTKGISEASVSKNSVFPL